MKKLFGSIFIFCLTLALILVAFQLCFAELTKTGSFKFGATKNFNTCLENINMDLDLSLKGETLGVDIDIELITEKSENELTQFLNEWNIQGEYYLKSKNKMYGFGSLGVKENKEWDIDARTAIGIGVGYKDMKSKFMAQGGLYWATLYADDTYGRQSIARLQIEKEHEFYKPFSVSAKAAGELNLAEIHAFNSIFNDYLTETELAIIGRINKNMSVVAAYQWDYCHTADVTDQKLLGLFARAEF